MSHIEDITDKISLVISLHTVQIIETTDDISDCIVMPHKEARSLAKKILSLTKAKIDLKDLREEESVADVEMEREKNMDDRDEALDEAIS